LHAHIPQESKPGVTPQLKRKVTVNFPTKDKGSVFVTGCDILPDGKLVFTDQEGKRLLMFSNNGNYENDIVRFRMARRFMVKSVPQHLWPIFTVFVMVLVMTFTNTTSRLSKIVTATMFSPVYGIRGVFV
jgi:hypothetical protein